ncbi:MAG: PAS domain S-box protein, partial [Phycisphaerales bacterium]
MSSNIKNEENNLRKKAEEKLKRKYDYLKKHNTGPVTKATEELWIHQIELEMQNEEIRKTQKELEEAKQKYSDLFDFAPVGYFIIDRDGNIIEANLTGSSMVSKDRASLINKPLSLFIKKEYWNAYHSQLQKVFHQKANQRCELKMLKKNEEKEFDAEIIFQPILGKSENIEECRIAIIDITARKLLEQELSNGRTELENRVKERTTDLLQVVNLLRNEVEQRKRSDIELQKRTKELEQSEKKYRTLIEVSPDAICVAVDDKVVFVNNTAISILNAKNEEELKGKTIWQFVHPDSIDIIKNRLERFLQGKREIEIVEVTLIRTDGSFFEAGGTVATME